jgi:uncharacterized protein (TIGR02646 family)
MIRVNRPPPAMALSDRRLAELEKHAGQFFLADTRSSRQRSFDFGWPDRRIEARILEALDLAWASRCAFCGIGDELEIHRFRPAQDAVAEDGETSRRHYWWLAYEWNNLYPACKQCREAQGAKFPTAEDRVRVGTTERLNERELPLLLDPCDDDPEALLIYSEEGEVASEDRRALITIETFDLNRPELVHERRLTVQWTRSSLSKAGEKLDGGSYRAFANAVRMLYSEAAPFAAVRRQFANQWVQFRPRIVERGLLLGTNGEVTLDLLVGGLPRVTGQIRERAFHGYHHPVAESVSVPTDAETVRRQVGSTAGPGRRAAALEEEVPYLRAVEAHSLEIRNFRGIEHLDIDLSSDAPEGRWTMLLGENGVGKSSILQALALALSDPETVRQLGVHPRKILRQGSDKGLVRVHFARGYRELLFGKGIEGFEVAGSPLYGVLLAGYGPTRLLPDGRDQDPSAQKVANLFDPRAPLVDPGQWLPGLQSKEFDAVARALRKLLELPENEEITRARGLEIVRRKFRYGLDQLSDGYRSMAIFSLDLMQLLLRRWGSIAAAEGIVLIDEIGAHLHPRWQMRVTSLLRETFPRMQFIATTHDPLCLRGLHDGEVVVLREQRRRIYALQRELPPVAGLAVDQLLTSEHFGLSSTLDPEIQGDFDRYYELLAKRRRSGSEEGELDDLAGRLDHLNLLGSTLRERLALEAVDEFLADDSEIRSERDFVELKASTKQAVREIWEAGLTR